MADPILDLYQQVLGRDPRATGDQAGYDYWKNMFMADNQIDPNEMMAFLNAAKPELASRKAAPAPTPAAPETVLWTGSGRDTPPPAGTTTTAPAKMTAKGFADLLKQRPNINPIEFAEAMYTSGLTPQQVAQATGYSQAWVNNMYNSGLSEGRETGADWTKTPFTPSATTGTTTAAPTSGTASGEPRLMVDDVLPVTTPGTTTGGTAGTTGGVTPLPTTGGGTTATGAGLTALDPSQSTLSPNFAQYVYNMLGRGEAAANLPYQPFTGQRFAGASPLQQRAFELASKLETPEQFGTASEFAQKAFDKAAGTSYTPTTFDTGLGAVKSVQEYMSPYQQAVTDITGREMRRQADIGRQAEQARLAQAGAYGGSRQAIMEAERQRNLQQQLEDVTTKGLQSSYDRALQQRLAESSLGLEAQKGTEGSRQFGANLGLQAINPMLGAASTLSNIGQQQSGAGLQNLQAQLGAGATQQGFMQQPLDFGYQQFQESVRFPYQQATYMQSLLGGLPLQAMPYSSSQGQSGMFTGLQGALAGLALYDAMNPSAPKP